jgi:hypothetical protein
VPAPTSATTVNPLVRDTRRGNMSIGVPVQIGRRLADFANAAHLTLGEALAALFDHGAKTGLRVSLQMPGIEIMGKGDYLELAIDHFAPFRFHVAQVVWFAGQLREIAAKPGAAVIRLEDSVVLEISRKGNGVALSVDRDGVPTFKRVFACGVAKALADRLEEAAEQAATATAGALASARSTLASAPGEAEEVEALLGDLDLDLGPDATTVVVLDIADTDVIERVEALDAAAAVVEADTV